MLKYYYCFYLKKIKERENPQELGRIAQDIVAIDLKLCNHTILEYHLVGSYDITTEFDGVRYIFEVKNGKFEIEDVNNIKEVLKTAVGEKRLIFFDFSFPARLLCFNLEELPDDLVIPCFKEDEKLSNALNDKLPEAVKKYYEFYSRGGAKIARRFVEDFIFSK